MLLFPFMAASDSLYLTLCLPRSTVVSQLSRALPSSPPPPPDHLTCREQKTKTAQTKQLHACTKDRTLFVCAACSWSCGVSCLFLFVCASLTGGPIPGCWYLLVVHSHPTVLLVRAQCRGAKELRRFRSPRFPRAPPSKRTSFTYRRFDHRYYPGDPYECVSVFFGVRVSACISAMYQCMK